jgi:hypothetical protein
MHEHSHLLVTRPVEPHPRGGATDATIHLGDGHRPLRLSLDLVQKAAWDARSKGEHVATIARLPSRVGCSSVPKAHEKSK